LDLSGRGVSPLSAFRISTHDGGGPMRTVRYSKRIGTVFFFIFFLAVTPAGADSWEVRGDVPEGDYIVEAVVAEGRIFAFGATPSGSEARTYEFIPGATPAEDVWVPRAPKPDPPIGNHRAAVLDGLIYLPGGSLASGLSTDGMTAYDYAADTWRVQPTLPEEVNSYALALLDGKIHIAGGCCTDGAALQIFDPATGWATSSARLSDWRNGPAGAAAGGRFFTIGGFRTPGGPGSRVGTVDVYSPDTDSMETWTDMAIGRDGHDTIVCGDYIYVFGGLRGGARGSPDAARQPRRLQPGRPGLPGRGPGRRLDG